MLQEIGEHDSEARWQAWLAKGRAHDLRVRRKVKIFGLWLVVAAALSAAILVLR